MAAVIRTTVPAPSTERKSAKDEKRWAPGACFIFIGIAAIATWTVVLLLWFR